MEEYFRHLDEEVTRAYEVATRARALGIDPEPRVEIPRAQDLASRVEKLLAKWPVSGVAVRIRELSAQTPKISREEVAITLAQEMAGDASRGSVAERLEVSLRVGLAILTEGIVVAPLEGLVKVEVHPDPQGDYVDLYYAGPIRAAGGGAQAVSVLLADVVREKLGLSRWHATEQEISRYCEELPLYKHLQHLQYSPSVEEIRTVVSRLPVCIDGEATEGDQEVSAFRNVPRVGTNGVRGGACLVIAEGLCLKAPKVRKIVDNLRKKGLSLSDWDFLDKVGLKGAKEDDEGKGSLPKYLAEAVGGRPVLAYPHRPGGFRLVYGRCRTTGLASCGVNPATMVLLRHFVAIGTQVKTELPGKAAAISLCDTVEGPLVLLRDGTYLQVNDAERAKEVLPEVDRILDLGELLVSFGEFLENNRPLAPGGYSLAWHLEVLRAKGATLDRRALAPTFPEALEDAKQLQVPLHPRFNLFWHDLSAEALRALSRRVEDQSAWSGGTLHLPMDPSLREELLVLGLPHHVEGGSLVLDPERAPAFLLGLGLEVVPSNGELHRRAPLEGGAADTMAEVVRLSGVAWKPRAPTRIGARVGRPEKAYQRVMSPNVHVLFPVGEAGGAKRSVLAAADRAREAARPSYPRNHPSRPSSAASPPAPPPSLSVALGIRRCEQCGQEVISNRCACGGHTRPTERSVAEPVPFHELWERSLRALGFSKFPRDVKGVKGLMSESKTPEPLEKGVLRALHNISVYQDGTTRFDLTDLPLTHFRPCEVGLPLAKAHALGYTHDWTGAPLERVDQLLEVLPHDIIVAKSCGDYLLALSHFLDDELHLLYGMDPYYRGQNRYDLLGSLVIALAPHTSGGVLGRLIGFTDVEGCFAHPVFHAAKRRNCDGDEDSVTLLLDGLLNFSFAYLPVKRGALMDKPLVLTTRLDSREVDKEAQNVDVACSYPLALYEAAEQGASPKAVESLIDTLGKRLEKGPLQFSRMGFTHDTADIGAGPRQSAYREARGMERTVEETLLLGAQLRAVDVSDAVGLLLNHHFLPDIMGNMKSYATQRFRCKVCGSSLRRPALDGRCPELRGKARCGGELLPTVYPSNVTKYLGLSRDLAKRYGVSPYLRQRVEILESSFASLFPTSPGAVGLEEFHAPDRPTPPPPPEEEPPSEPPPPSAPAA
ncbi:MAG: DNA polymerase II large subunit [Euryarchaeota archaeon]|nr:DNA polymerase II large subunit [Euryarchaeota archaeon]MDE1835561.1 DNA polymerase II large subunit [Euryarchaeota archaeon]MDE1878909.1 DNA polymerase II large subunit [Euryarchaeota archaeon]MDE2043817.1 DNA polymerase II large subunit [Thermoplasmata archaeon]